ncbi:SusC/RagA family TonB-linked outer membrane protein [Filimonas effusa]|nr:SusC/RagA family TonB-linked outer membrane protein [Filimonas effusa]
MSENNVPIEKVFRIIEDQTGYVFFYEYALLGKAKKVSINVKDAYLSEVLQLCFKDQPLNYKVVDKTVVIKSKAAAAIAIVEQAAATPPPVQDVSGIITDEDGNPLPNVAVKVKGTEKGASTDKNGHFMIRGIDQNAILVISYVGYETTEKALQGARALAIQMKPVINELNQTVVIGYGTTTKRKSTGSIASITSEEISKQPIANPLNALQGRVAGAIVTQSNGLPGARVTIQIRGNTSLDQTGAGNQPLYLVDGVPFNMYDNSVPVTNDLNSRGNFAAAGGLSPFSIINPAEIERIDILKDADATAIYGTRGANGVVLITTKKGKAGKTKLSLNLYQGQGKVGHFIPMMNTQQYLQLRKEAFANDGVTPTATNAPDLVTWDQNAYTDWQDRYLGGTASTTDVQATVSGGDQRTRFLLNAGYHRETPVFPGSYDDKRISTRMNVEHSSLDRRFNANVSINYAFNNTNLLSRDLSTLYNLPTNMPLFNADGTLSWNANFNNPESNLLVKYFGKTHNLMTNTMLRYTILPGLDIKTSFGFNKIQLNQNVQEPAGSKNPLTTTVNNSAAFTTIDQQSYILEPQITYNRSISRGKLSALLGSTFQNSLNTSQRNSASNYSSPALLGGLSGAGAYGTPSYGYTQYRYTSVFGRLNYDWESKYFLNAVLRRDGSSRFGSDRKFGNFWSIGGAWAFSKEKFADNWRFMSFGKLRASYGVTGNDQIQDYQYQAFYNSAGTYQGGSALAPDKIDNPTLQWQTTRKLEFGLDMAFLKDRVQVTANYYRNTTPNQLGYLQLSPQAGFNSYSSNFDAVIRNNGFELEVNAVIIDKKDFRWNTAFNITVPKTILVSASPSYYYYNQSVIGQPLGAVFRYTYQGVDVATGKPLYKDVAKDSLTFTPNFSTDRAYIGYTAPKYYGGINNSFSYKQFELSFFFQFTKQDGNIWPTSAPGVLSSGNQTTYWLDRWTQGNHNAALPRATSTTTIYSAYSSSNAAWGDNSFLRLRTANLSYNFPSALTSKWKIESMRLYLQGQNLWWTSKNKYVYDPETGTSMPPLRVITAGINVTF